MTTFLAVSQHQSLLTVSKNPFSLVPVSLAPVLVTAALTLLVLSGCTEPLYHDLDEDQANEMVVVLSQYGLEAGKLRDPLDSDRWAVQVPQDQRVDAWGVLKEEGLPRPAAGGFKDFYPSSGLIPTAQEERVLLQYATARELQSSLLRVDGVVDAHVHLVLPEKPRVQMSNTVISPPRASVLVLWRARDGESPLSESEIRHLISGGVEGLEPDAVHVVQTPVASQSRQVGPPELVFIGPLAVSPSSQGPLKVLIFVMGALVILLSAGIVYLVMTRRQTAEVL